jgi:acyl carrier protein
MTPDTLARVRGIIASYLHLPEEQVGADVALESLGIDSLGALELVFQIEEAFGVSVPDERIPDFKTVRAICDGIEALQKASAPAP